MNSSTWTVLGYEAGRELPVGRTLNRFNLIYFLPMELRQRRASKHAKRREAYEVPLIPGIVFIRGQDTWMKATEAKYTEDSPLSDTSGNPWRIPEPQMSAFQSAVAEWNETVRKRTMANKDAPKLKKRTVKFTPDALADIKSELFGAGTMGQAA